MGFDIAAARSCAAAKGRKSAHSMPSLWNTFRRSAAAPLSLLLCLCGPLAATSAAAQVPLLKQHGDRTVVAHRGASSYLPEHSLACYAMAHAQGADYIEPDVVMTKDNVLVCLHDLYLETTTDIATRFPDRKRADGHYYAADFTLAEIKSLRVFGRVPDPERAEMQGHQVVTLEELILLVQRLNKTTGRNVGLLVETKAPEFHLKEGKPLEKPLLDLLTRHGYAKRDSGVIIQSFDGPHLKRLRMEHKTELPLMWLTGTLPAPATVEDAAAWADGVNPSRGALVSGGKLSDAGAAFLKRAKEKGLKVFVWTFNADTDVMQAFLYEYGVDGIITNNPDFGVRAVRRSAGSVTGAATR
jgi:glycerophosphoryl diester phosphodiesterase